MGEEAGELKSQRLSNSRPHPRPHKSASAPCKMDLLCLRPQSVWQGSGGCGQLTLPTGLEPRQGEGVRGAKTSP